MSAPAKTQSATHAEIGRLMQRVGPNPVVLTWENGNGHCCVAECKREDGRVVRIYSEGAASPSNAERVCLAAVTSLVGGA